MILFCGVGFDDAKYSSRSNNSWLRFPFQLPRLKVSLRKLQWDIWRIYGAIFHLWATTRVQGQSIDLSKMFSWRKDNLTYCIYEINHRTCRTVKGQSHILCDCKNQVAMLSKSWVPQTLRVTPLATFKTCPRWVPLQFLIFGIRVAILPLTSYSCAMLTTSKHLGIVHCAYNEACSLSQSNRCMLVHLAFLIAVSTNFLEQSCSLWINHWRKGNQIFKMQHIFGHTF